MVVYFRGLIALLTATCGTVLATEAGTCSCMRQSAAQQIESSALIFTGVPIRRSMATGMRQTTTFRVVETLKGAARPTQRIVHRTNDGANCGLNFSIGDGPMLILAYRADGALHANSCTMPQSPESEFRALLKRKPKRG